MWFSRPSDPPPDEALDADEREEVRSQAEEMGELLHELAIGRRAPRGAAAVGILGAREREEEEGRSAHRLNDEDSHGNQNLSATKERRGWRKVRGT